MRNFFAGPAAPSAANDRRGDKARPGTASAADLTTKLRRVDRIAYLDAGKPALASGTAADDDGNERRFECRAMRILIAAAVACSSLRLYWLSRRRSHRGARARRRPAAPRCRSA